MLAAMVSTIIDMSCVFLVLEWLHELCLNVPTRDQTDVCEDLFLYYRQPPYTDTDRRQVDGSTGGDQERLSVVTN